MKKESEVRDILKNCSNYTIDHKLYTFDYDKAEAEIMELWNKKLDELLLSCKDTFMGWVCYRIVKQ